MTEVVMDLRTGKATKRVVSCACHLCYSCHLSDETTPVEPGCYWIYVMAMRSTGVVACCIF
jgi:hypothetical protein